MANTQIVKQKSNSISPKVLLHSKWTKISVVNKERHFVVSDVEFNEDKKIIRCVIQAVISDAEYAIDWRTLKDGKQWLIGWR